MERVGTLARNRTVRGGETQSPSGQLAQPAEKKGVRCSGQEVTALLCRLRYLFQFSWFASENKSLQRETGFGRETIHSKVAALACPGHRHQGFICVLFWVGAVSIMTFIKFFFFSPRAAGLLSKVLCSHLIVSVFTKTTSFSSVIFRNLISSLLKLEPNSQIQSRMMFYKMKSMENPSRVLLGWVLFSLMWQQEP